MNKREYYSIRTGKNLAGKRLDLSLLKVLFYTVYERFMSTYYFQEAFGYSCEEAGEVTGRLGSDIEAYILRKIRKHNLWPIDSKWKDYSEDDLFDMIEFLYDQVSRPIAGYYHSYDECGWHYNKFDKRSGQDEFRSEVNDLLSDYDNSYELSVNGEILNLPEKGMELLLEAQLPICDPENVKARVDNAILKFRRYRSSIEERREAVRELANVLEFLRPQFKGIMTNKDDNDLFNIANNFGIRHHNISQKTEYDQSIWLPWMFYFYLATIHAALGLIEKKEKGSS